MFAPEQAELHSHVCLQGMTLQQTDLVFLFILIQLHVSSCYTSRVGNTPDEIRIDPQISHTALIWTLSRSHVASHLLYTQFMVPVSNARSRYHGAVEVS